MAVLYTTKATATGGRGGSVKTADGTLSFNLGVPKELGGPGKADAANPEQLFACGYAACFGGAVDFVAKQKKVNITGVEVTCEVGIGPRDAGGFGLDVALTAVVGGVSQQQAQELVNEAHEKICPYSHATRNNVPVKVTAKAG